MSTQLGHDAAEHQLSKRFEIKGPSLYFSVINRKQALPKAIGRRRRGTTRNETQGASAPLRPAHRRTVPLGPPPQKN